MWEKGVRSNLPERPEGCFAQIRPDPFFPSAERAGEPEPGGLPVLRSQEPALGLRAILWEDLREDQRQETAPCTECFRQPSLF
jgi:hypothetical protein